MIIKARDFNQEKICSASEEENVNSFKQDINLEERGLKSMHYAILSNDKDFTIFKYGNYNIRFKSPYSLERYTSVKEWDDGYLVVMAKYTHNQHSEEEYIDLVPILEDLYISPETFLRPIKGVKISND